MNQTTDLFVPQANTVPMFVKNIWWISDREGFSRNERILPKGNVELIFNLADGVQYDNTQTGIFTLLPTVLINGVNHSPFDLRKLGKQEFLGIQMNTLGLKSIFNMPVNECNDAVYDGTLLCPDLGSVVDRLHGLVSFQDRVRVLVDWIRGRLYHRQDDKSLKRASELLNVTSKGQVTVRGICNDIGLSDRQLRRFTQDWFGMTTEELILYRRYLNTLHLLHKDSLNLTDIGLEAGYYDQAHFIREFRRFTHITPGEYRRSSRGIAAGHIFTV